MNIPRASVRPIAFAAAAALLPALAGLLPPQLPAFPLPGHYPMVHAALELLCVLIALLIFCALWNIRDPARPGVSRLLGAAFLGVGVLDFLHLMSFPGMPDFFTPNTPHKAIILWLAARLLQSAGLLLYAVNPRWLGESRAWRLGALGAVAAWVAAVSGLTFFAPERVPATFVPGVGLTPFKLGLEWLVMGLLAASVFFLSRRDESGQRAPALLAVCAWLMIGAEAAFTLYRQVDDTLNALGHFYKIAAFALLYRHLFVRTLQTQAEALEAAAQAVRQADIFRLLVEAAPDGILQVDAQGRIRQANPAAQAMFGYTEAELVGRSVEILLPEERRGRRARLRAAWRGPPRSRPMAAVPNLTARRRDGSIFPVDIALASLPSGEGGVAFVRDITERKAYEERLRHQATHDALTGLPNRLLLMDRLAQAIALARREGKRIGVLLLDLDNFKLVNDNFGHLQGDALLMEVATRLHAATRAGDTLARLGGDEFAAVLINVQDKAQVRYVAERLLGVLAQPVWLGNHEIVPAASIGHCLFPDDGDTAETLLRRADAAMYAAKAAGRGVAVGFRAEMEGSTAEDLHILSRLRQAVESGALALHYQPQVDAASQRILGAEALLRWVDAELGPVSPARFIPIAEESGLILPLGNWVLDAACRQIATWRAQGLELPVAVNLSVHQFRQADLVGKIRAACARHGCPVQLLELEITESAAMQSPEFTRRQLAMLAEAGFPIALDDFGTGQSSLGRLALLPVGKLKIDRSFVAAVPGNPTHETILRATIGLARELGMKLVAEGVETEAQRRYLLDHGCTVYQGWLFSKAVPAERLAALVRKQRVEIGGSAAAPSLETLSVVPAIPAATSATLPAPVQGIVSQ